jgi:CelD/BcsL family acetyltransferase involved in cellulose biosynthesis
MGAEALPPSLRCFLVDPDRLTDEVSGFWDALAAGSGAPDPSCCGPAWQVTALACSRRAGAPVFLRQSSDGQIAFALTASPSGLRFGPMEAHWGFGCPMLGPGSSDLLFDMIGQLRDAALPVPVKIDVPGLQPGGLHERQLATAFPDRHLIAQDAHAAASLGGGLEGWMSRRSANFRRNLQRAQRAADGHGIGFERHAPVTAQQARAVYRRMLDMEMRSWKGPGREGLLALPEFYGKLLAAYARRAAARVIIARAGGEDIGFCFGGLYGGIYRGQQTSYVEAWCNVSLGVLMHRETARWLCDDGANLQHFGPAQPGMAYKSRFCELDQPSVRVIVDLDC